MDRREISDPRALRALTHPTRLALIEALGLHGPLTATEAADHVGESPSSCSFHLRQLARYGFVEEAGGGTGRRRPWRMTNLGLSWGNVHDDPAAEIAAATLTDLLQSRQFQSLERWRRTSRAYPDAWRQAAISDQSLTWLTAEELAAIGEAIRTQLEPFRERLTDPASRPDDALPVQLLSFGFPLEAPA